MGRIKTNKAILWRIPLWNRIKVLFRIFKIELANIGNRWKFTGRRSDPSPLLCRDCYWVSPLHKAHHCYETDGEGDVVGYDDRCETCDSNATSLIRL